MLAVSSLYGVDILADNVDACRERLFNLWDSRYKAVCKKECNEDTRKTVTFILSKNIVCGNALTLCEVDENCNDTDKPIVFSEWAFITGGMLQRSDYTFAELLAGDEKVKQKSMFERDGEGVFLKKCITPTCFHVLRICQTTKFLLRRK